MGALTQSVISAGLVVMLVHSFNIDTRQPNIIRGDAASHFGYKVLQFGPESNPGIIVSAPLARDGTRNVTGAIYKCGSQSLACDPIPIPGSAESHIEGVGLSLATDSSSSPKLLMCAPSLSYSCGKNTYVNGICYQFDSTLSSPTNMTPAFQECHKPELDVAFLIDGSGSISIKDFVIMKDFMLSVINLLKGKEVQFSVAQFSDGARKEFDFNSYKQGSIARNLISRIKQMNSLTYTPTGIKFVADEIFTEDQGARPSANKVMIIITDGESNDPHITFNTAIKAANRKNILRYAIGVGDAFDTARATKELSVIASEPSADFVFKASNFDALKGINEKLKQKIFAIEGTGKSSGESSFKLELAQTGFSAMFTSESIILGAVGANDWAGGLIEVRDGKDVLISNSSTKDTANAYLGYSMVMAQRGGRANCVAGAPRYNHVGRVMIFERDNNGKNWTVKQIIEGEQMGSYFGVELSALDLDRDGETDFVLIGAPLYHESGIGGMVRVCTISLQGDFSCPQSLHGDKGNGLGRFGSAITALRDLNGDGLGDVAIGAPLEDEHRGSVYIYHGERSGISPRYSQRIAGSRITPGLKYFGLSIDGKMDLTGDGLTDLVVGALGGAVILSSTPVLLVQTNVTFDPAEIPLASFDCAMNANGGNANVDVHVCFHMGNATPNALDSLSAYLNYTLDLDPGRQKSRVEFRAKERTSTHLVNLTLGENCFLHRIKILACMEDFFNPVQLTLKYCVEGKAIPEMKNLTPAIKEKCVNNLLWKLPFEKNCGTDQVCVADLDLTFNVSGTDVLIVYPGAQLNLTVQLKNTKENSYQTTVKFFHPPGISFRKLSILKSNRKLRLACDDIGTRGESEVTTCNVNHPVFGEDAEVVFVTTLDVSNAETWNHSLRINVTAYSDNEAADTLTNNQAGLVIPVQYRVNLLLKTLNSSSYVNFSLGSTVRKEVTHRYLVENLGRRQLPVSLTFIVPERLGHRFLWNVSGVTTEKAPTNRIRCDVRGTVGGRAGVAGTNVNQTDKDCMAETCQVMLCLVEELVQKGPLTFALRGNLFVTNTTQMVPELYRLQSIGRLDFDRIKYIQAGDYKFKELFHHANVTTDVEMFEEVNYIPWIAGGAVGGLVLLILLGLILYKVGFFKRNFKDLMNENNPQNVDVAEEGCNEPLSAAPASE